MEETLKRGLKEEEEDEQILRSAIAIANGKWYGFLGMKFSLDRGWAPGGVGG